MKSKFVVWFNEVDKEDIALVGGKGANLGEMTQAGFPVPPGFIVTAEAYRHFINVNKLQDDIEAALYQLDVSDNQKLDKAAKDIQRKITRSQFPRDVATEIIRAYFKLDNGILKHPLVAVRSSATAEDLPTASFAGQQATFLNVSGEANLLEKIKEAWASLFTARAIFYRATHGFDHFKVAMAVPVQKMIQADASGVMFTIDPVTNDKKRIVIEAVLGLGETIVQGAVTPDHYVVDKEVARILEKEVNVQEKLMRRKRNINEVVSLPREIGARQKIDDEQIVSLAKLGKKLEQHYYFPQDIEWAIEKGTIYILQTRPVTTVGKEAVSGKRPAISTKDILLRGDPASPGMASGPVRILKSAREIHRVVKGEVLVAEMTNPDFVPAMRKVVAIVTERGGRTSHAAIVSRELGIPAVVGAAGARKVLKEGVVITVNGSTGEVLKGTMAPNIRYQISDIKYGEQANKKTATKVYVNLAEPDRARDVAKLNVDGIGLLRAEFMIAGIGIHPKKIIKDRKQKVFVDTLSVQLEKFCAAFSPRPVVYRTTDFKTNEYRNLTGGKAFEPDEPNPMLGFRGAARYIADPQVLELELETIKTVRNKLGYKNLWVMLPFVRTPKELLEVKKIIAGNGLTRSPSFKLWLMVEIPANVVRIDDFLDVGIDGVSIGSNDLTMLMLGTDRDNSEVAHDFSEQDPTLLWAFEHVITRCAKRNVTTSMCGQAPSDYPELVEKLVSWGITSLSVNPDAVDQARETISAAEQRLVARK